MGLLHHIRAQSEQGYRILLITTVNIDSPWLYKLPKKVQHLNLGKWHDDLYYDYLRIAILKKLLCQSTATSIHNVNSEWGWRVFRYEGGALKTIGKQLFISAFTGIPHKNGMLLGYADGYLPFCYQNISRVFCDTQWYPDELIKRWHLPPHLFQALYFPCVLPQSTTCESQQNSPILWASRFCTQKRPELLYAIAQKLPEREFHVYGTCESNCESQLAQLQTLPNVHYFGAYDDFASLVSKQKYVAFLYTSAYDGLPNVLLEAIASGLPVLASDVGGIHEFIHHKMLLPNGDDISAYITQIQNALNDDKLLQQSWEYSYELLRERHSWQHFVTSLTKNQGYFPQNSNQS